MEESEFISDDFGDLPSGGESLSREMQIARFRTFAKDHFQDLVKKETDYLEYIKRSSQFYSFRLPQDKGEFFISYNTAPLYWLCDPPAVIKFEEWLKQEARGRSSVLDGYRTIREFYSKWATLKSDQEKKYYSLSALKLAERELNKENILVPVLQAVILTYDKNVFNPSKAFELLQNALGTLENLKIEDQLKNELKYLIYIYSGFALLKQANYLDASLNFSEAARASALGLTAKFYLAFSEKRAGDRNSALLLIGDILHFDRTAIEFAVEMNSMALVTYFIRNALTYNIFAETDFADLLEDIETAISVETGMPGLGFAKISDALTKLSEARVKDFYTGELEKSIAFLDKACMGLIGNKNTIADYAQAPLQAKFFKITETILETIRQKFFGEVTDQLKPYEVGIAENLNVIRHLEKEEEEIKNSQKKKLAESLEDLDRIINDNIVFVENKIENINDNPKFNPHSVFNNAMVYNLIITMVVFAIGGFAGCSRSSLDDSEGIRDVMSTVMLAGIKWGMLTFFIGTIISGFMAAFAVMERTTEKQNLLRKITYFKAHKERETELIIRENEKRLKTIAENFKERVQSHKKSVDKLRSEREERNAALLEEANGKIQVYIDRLDVVLKLEPS